MRSNIFAKVITILMLLIHVIISNNEIQLRLEILVANNPQETLPRKTGPPFTVKDALTTR